MTKFLSTVCCVLTLVFGLVARQTVVPTRGLSRHSSSDDTLLKASAFFAIAAAISWIMSIWRKRRDARANSNICPNCNYDRAGLNSDAPCPECNALANVAIRPQSLSPWTLILSVLSFVLILVVWTIGNRTDANLFATVVLMAIPLLYAWKVDSEADESRPGS